jgi:16S rRNA (guanine527-N7)-methyltransferase
MLRLGGAERQQLIAGGAALGVEIDSDAESRFAAYADLLGLWSTRVNLIACPTAAELVDRHFLDSLAVDPLLPADGAVADLGSGAGFPGLPLAIVNPERRIVLVEARRRRASFLREARRTLALENLEVLEQRAEQPPAAYHGRAAAVVSRAVWADQRIFAIAGTWLLSDGALIWMRTEPLPVDVHHEGFLHQATIRYRIGQGRPRAIELCARV